MASLGAPNLVITVVAGTPNAKVKLTGKVYFTNADKFLMDSAFAKGAKWFYMNAYLWGKDSHEGSTDSMRYWLFGKYYPLVATTPNTVDYDSGDITVPLSVLNEDPSTGAADEIYAKVTLFNQFADTKKEISSNLVTYNFGT